MGATFGGLWLGSVVAFQLGRTLWKEYARSEMSEHASLKLINRMVEAEGVKIVFLARMCPLLPAEVFNYVCSVTSLTLMQYAAGCLGSVVPVAFWVASSAQATAAASRGESEASSHGYAYGGHLWLILFNVSVIAGLTAMLLLTYSRLKGRLRSEPHGDDDGHHEEFQELSDFRG